MIMILLLMDSSGDCFRVRPIVAVLKYLNLNAVHSEHTMKTYFSFVQDLKSAQDFEDM